VRPLEADSAGRSRPQRRAACGASRRPPLRWFTPDAKGVDRPELRFRIATGAAILAGRLCGAALPWPEPVPLADPTPIARWMAEQRDRHGRVWLNTPVSSAVRVAQCAVRHSIDLTGATFMVAGEPVTRAKVSQLLASGAKYFSDYGMAESGRIAIGCAMPRREGDVHVLLDAVAVIGWPRAAVDGDAAVRALHVTVFDRQAPMLLLNVEFDDDGVIDEGPCGCPLEDLGLRTHLTEIRSHGRLTGEGVTLVGADMVRVLEEVLPQRFNASPLDFQVVEEEDEAALTRVVLVASPRVDATDEALRAAALEALSRTGGSAALAQAIWREADTLRVRREEPYVTARGKQPSLKMAASRRSDARRDG
jgi:hypothetical protein